MPADLIHVRDVYGQIHRVRRADYEGTRTRLPLYTESGTRFCDHFEAMNWRDRVTAIHRENIAAVL